MAFDLEILIVDPSDKTIKVGHHFYGLTEEEARHYFKEHLACEYLAAAVREGRTIETLDEIDDDELPEAEEDDEEES
jgi:pyrroloquinoline quinone (PQQ) biosynthesis protein C